MFGLFPHNFFFFIVVVVVVSVDTLSSQGLGGLATVKTDVIICGCHLHEGCHILRKIMTRTPGTIDNVGKVFGFI